MIIAHWINFLGACLRVHPKRLADGLGVDAVNIRRGSGDFRPLNGASTVVTTGGATPIMSAWRFGRSATSDTSGWVQWTTDVDVVRSLIASDPTEEIYFTGSGAPKATDTAIGLPAGPGPASARTLGIPAPATAIGTPTVMVAGTGTSETRVYVDTFVNDRGRESSPGHPVIVQMLAGSTASIASLSAVPSGNHGINIRHLYVSTDGGPFQRFASLPATSMTATDNGVRGTVLQSGGDTSKPAWLEPPANLAGLVDLWNGMIGGFSGKSYMVCEPNKPWAWPAEYQEVLPHDIVGTAKYSHNWVILTTAQPYVVTGSGPLNMGHRPVDFLQACASKRSVLSIGSGVVWASQNGLCYIGDGGTSLLTEGLFQPEQWQAFQPATMVCARWERFVLVFFENGTSTKGLMIDPSVAGQGAVFLTQGAKGAFYDPISDRLYLLDAGNAIKRWAGGPVLTARWKSNVVRHSLPTNAGFGLVVSDEPVGVLVTIWASVLVADGTYSWQQVFSRNVQSNQPFALPGGYEAQDYQAQVETTGTLQGLFIAEDVDDLP